MTSAATTRTLGRPEQGPRSPSQGLDAGGSRYQLLDQLLADTPWSVRDLQNLILRSAAGLALIVGGWVGASSTVEWGTQLIWIGVGLSGAVVAAVTWVGWLLNGLASVSRERTVIRHAIADRLAARSPHVQEVPAAESEQDTLVQAGALVAAPDMRHFHRPDCQVVEGKHVDRLTFAECMDRELEPCGMCRP